MISLALLSPSGPGSFPARLAGRFDPKVFLTSPLPGDFDLVIVAGCASVDSCLGHVKRLLKAKPDQVVVAFLHDGCRLADRMAALQAGCADVLDESVSDEELCSRLDKLIFHQIANKQLQLMSRVDEAHRMAMLAMTGSTALLANMRFMIDSAATESLDELGLLLFRALAAYGIKASLQMRHRTGIKNMEANGMAREMESQLLFELRDAGTHIEFGSRLVINAGQVSLLVKNMPTEDADRCDDIREHVASLMQGADGRLRAMDRLLLALEEHDIMDNMSHQMRGMMHNVEHSNQSLIRGCADVVEEMAQNMENVLSELDLREHQEMLIRTIMSECVQRINEQYRFGLHVDETFTRLTQHIDESLAKCSHSYGL